MRGTAQRGWGDSIPCLQPCWSVHGIWLALTPLVTRVPAPSVSPRQTCRTVCLGGTELQVGWQPAGLSPTRWVPPPGKDTRSSRLRACFAEPGSPAPVVPQPLCRVLAPWPSRLCGLRSWPWPGWGCSFCCAWVQVSGRCLAESAAGAG